MDWNTVVACVCVSTLFVVLGLIFLFKVILKEEDKYQRPEGWHEIRVGHCYCGHPSGVHHRKEDDTSCFVTGCECKAFRKSPYL